MDIKSSQAASAYGSVAKMKVEESDESGSAGGFSGLLKETLGNAVDTIKHAEQVGMDSLAGKAGVTDMVTALNAAEMTLSTVVAVRDRMISAYQDIIKMPI